MQKSQSLISSFTYAWSGVRFAVKQNRNLQIHFIIAFFVLILGFILDLTTFEIGVVFVTVLLVISTEMINVAIEEVVNLLTKEHRLEAKIAKDVGAGMVLIASIGSVFVGFLVFIPHIIKLVK